MADFITNMEGNAFMQVRRSQPFEWLTCTGVGDLEIPEGDRTPAYCQDPLNSGEWKIDGFIRGDKGAGTYQLTKPLSGVYNFLIELKCDFVLRINWVCRGLRGDPRNYEVAALATGSEFTSRAIRNPVREPDGASARVNTNGTINFIEAKMLYKLEAARQTVANTADANGVYFLPERCEDRCGSYRGMCEHGIIGLDRGVGYTYDAEVKRTVDGETWAATSVDPFSYGGDILAVHIFETLSGQRYLVFRGASVAGAPAECSYSEDGGATWTSIFIGDILGQYVTGYALSGAKILVSCSGGYIYSSLDQGDTWVLEEAGVETTQLLNDICTDPSNEDKMYAVGNTNAFIYSINAGDGWAARTGPAVGSNLTAVACNDKGHVFVGTNSGRIYRSEDGGVTWTLWVNRGGGIITDIKFDPELDFVGVFTWNDPTGLGWVYRSEDGGATWYVVTVPTNSGLNGIHMCDLNHIYVVGDVHGGTTFIAKLTPAA